MKVTLTDLRAATNILFDYLESTDRNEFEIAEDYYWNVVDEQSYDQYNDPNQFDLGQLSFDWCNLQEMIGDQEQHPPIGYGLVWLSSILRVIGKRNVA